MGTPRARGVRIDRIAAAQVRSTLGVVASTEGEIIAGSIGLGSIEKGRRMARRTKSALRSAGRMIGGSGWFL